ncbi:MAG TPA: outer membrane beta-barrel protein [Saprospiraceae bacterium]|nr:outer membrane beta-barrel protein [Saprospiraceae bacterium]
MNLLKAFFISLFILIFSPLYSQFSYGALIGLNTFDVAKSEQLLKNKSTRDSFLLSFYEAGYGFHFGGFVRYKTGHFFIQPELSFNSNTVTYKIKNPSILGTLDSLKKERYNNIDIPLMLGLKFGVLRLEAGPVMHTYIASKSDLTKIDGFQEKFATATFGYQAGVGFDLGKLMFDLRHEGNFTELGSHIRYFNDPVKFGNKPTRLLATLGIRF